MSPQKKTELEQHASGFVMQRLRCSELLLRVSPGELFDRMIILELKAARMEDEAARQRSQKEADAIGDYIYGGPNRFPLPRLEDLIEELRKVNSRLWDIENSLRSLDSVVFGPDEELEQTQKYLGLARSVYQTNDRRGELKSQLNRAVGSEINPVEDKEYAHYDR